MTNKKINIVDLPEDLVVDILSRLSAVSLARLRSTSKIWNALIKVGRLAKKHFAKAPRESPMVIMLMDSRVYLVSINLHGIHTDNFAPYAKVTGQFSLKDPLSDNSSEEVDIRNVSHCDGLLLCTTKSNNRVVVWNPCSGEKRWIQLPRAASFKEYILYALGYDNKSSCYKILRMHRLNIEYEIYDLTSNLWRVAGVITDWFIPQGWRCAMSVKGNTYWLSFTKRGHNVTLLSFDFSTERFQSLHLPQSLLYLSMALSVVREDQLFLLTQDHFDPVRLHVWVTTKIESNGVISWSKFLTAITYFKFSWWTSFFVDHENKVLVCCDQHEDSKEIFLCILGETNKYIQVDHDSGESNCTFLLAYYVPSLVQIQQGV